jgi:hypothetical protein
VAGTLAPNKPVFYRSTPVITARASQLGVNISQFTNGCNRGVANGAIGVNTGEFNPKTTDFNRVLRYGVSASYIGQREAAVTANEDRLWAIPGFDQAVPAVQVGFNSAASSTAPLATYGTTIVCENHTGLTMPAGSWAWGLLATAVPVPPTVDAGGPYTAILPNPVQLAGTITAGTGTIVSILWSVVSGGTGTFSNAAIEDPTFTVTTAGPNPIILLLTVTPSDGPAISDTATMGVVG